MNQIINQTIEAQSKKNVVTLRFRINPASGSVELVTDKPFVRLGQTVKAIDKAKTEEKNPVGRPIEKLHRVIILNGQEYKQRGQPSRGILLARNFVMLPKGVQYNAAIHGKGKPFVSNQTPKNIDIK